MKTKIKWIAGIFFLLGAVSFGTMGFAGIFSAILLFIAGLICLPPTLEIIEKLINTNLNTWKKYVIVIGLWILAALSYRILLKESSNPSNTTEKISVLEKTETVSKVKEELPPLKTCTSDIGTIRTNGNGSIGSKTEFTELAKLLKNKDCDILEVVFVQKSPPDRNYDDMDLKVIYNRTNGVLQSIFTETNVIEEFNNVNEECLKKFLKSGYQNFNSITQFCKESNYDFNNREMKKTAIGTKPEQSELDGSVKIVEDYIKSNAKNASSVDFLEWTKVSEMGEYWVVRSKYKGTNSFGAIVTQNSWFYIQNSKVVDTKDVGLDKH